MLLSYLAERAASLSSQSRSGHRAGADRRRPILACLLVAVAGGARADLPDATFDRSAEHHCSVALDVQAERLRAGRTASVKRELEALLSECSELPQIRHDLGVIAARTGDWETAVVELEASIALDARAADTVEALREIHRWGAKAAYAKALGEPRAPASGPIPNVQDSRLVNSDTRRAQNRDALLRDEAMLDYELFSWWSTATDNTRWEHRAHYVPAFDGLTLADLGESESRPDWDEVNRDIGFTAEDAVAVLRWTTPGPDARSRARVLLLRLTDDRWTIYEDREI